MESVRTQTGTLIVNGIEYNEYPPPRKLVKIMERKWAEEIVRTGSIRLRKIEYYRRWENELLGDPNEGEGLYHLHGHPMQIGSTNDVYVWCLSLPVIEPNRVLLLAKHGGYDCMLVIHSPEKLFREVASFLSQQRNGYILHCGLVNYNRGEEVDKRTLNSQKFHYNIFQKSVRFKDDKEYRISVTNTTFNRLPEDHFDLLLGNCQNILSMEDLPTN
jgi:hypothetical protein